MGIDDNVSLPGSFSLEQNYPNPFNPATSINYSVERAGNVKLSLYNLIGQRIMTLVNESKEPGEYAFELHAGDLASGVYFYKMTQHGKTVTRKLVLMK